MDTFALRYSNGGTEGLNNKIKLIKRVSFVYRSFYPLHNRIYIIQELIFKQVQQNRQKKSYRFHDFYSVFSAIHIT